MSQAVMKPVSSAAGGVGLRANLDAASDALMSMHSGSSAPTYAQVGTMWLDTSGSPTYLKRVVSIGPIVSVTECRWDGLAAPDWYPTVGGTGNAVTLTATPFTPTALFDGRVIAFRVTNANSGAVTVQEGSLTAKALVDVTGAALVTGQLVVGQVVTARYSSGADKYIGTSIPAVSAAASTTEVKNESAVSKYIQPDRLSYSDRVAKAWLRLDGGNPPTVQDSFNVTSVTWNSTGDYTVNLTTALANANYAVAATGQAQSGTVQAIIGFHASTAPTASALRINVNRIGSANSFSDAWIGSLAIFGDR